MVAMFTGAAEAPDPQGMTGTMGERNDWDEPLAFDAAGFLEVGSLEQLRAGASMRVTVGASDLLLVNIDGRVVAIGDLCLRCSGSLSTASLAGRVLTCGGCGWKYDVERGCVDGLPNLRIERHDVRVDDGRLLVSSAISAPATVSVSSPRRDAQDGGGATRALFGRACRGRRAQATMFTPPSTYIVPPVIRRA